MIRWLRERHYLTSLALFCVDRIAGLQYRDRRQKDGAAKVKAKEKDHDHDLRSRQTWSGNGGPVVEWGSDEFHAEFTVDHPTKTVIVYILDGEMKKARIVVVSRISAGSKTHVVASEKPKIEIDLTHDPKKSGKDGIAFTWRARFFCQAGRSSRAQSSPCSTKTRKRRRKRTPGKEFDYEPKKEGGDKKKTVSTEDLYRTPGGIYTAADIKANGDVPPKVKFKGIAHREEALKVGDKMYPISKEKASSEVTWVIAGERYEFCCPPCVERFLKLAHNEPEKVKKPAEYVFKGP